MESLKSRKIAKKIEDLIGAATSCNAVIKYREIEALPMEPLNKSLISLYDEKSLIDAATEVGKDYLGISLCGAVFSIEDRSIAFWLTKDDPWNSLISLIRIIESESMLKNFSIGVFSSEGVLFSLEEIFENHAVWYNLFKICDPNPRMKALAGKRYFGFFRVDSKFRWDIRKFSDE